MFPMQTLERKWQISNKQESLELQNTIIKLKKSLESFKSRHGNVEARISDLQSKTLEITREAKRKKKRNDREKKAY